MATRKRGKATSLSIRDLLSWRLHSVAGLCSSIAGLRVERKFGLSLLEWRAVGQLGGFAPLSLKDLAKLAGLDKSYASRTVAALVERGLVCSERNGADARGVMLSLTPAGQTLYKKALADALARNQSLLEPLTAKQQQQLMEALHILTIRARELFDLERRAAAGEPVEQRASGTASARIPRKKRGEELTEVRYLVSKLTELVGGR